jgi:bifunctional DNase/RNase
MVVDSLQLSSENYKHVLILKEKDGKRSLPIFVGLWEAEAIVVKLQNITVPRPATHDLLCNVLTAMGFKVKSVTISRLQDEIYHAELLLIAHDKLSQLDCRPSDAVAVAIRVGAPIFTDEKVLDEAGMILDPETGKPI